MLTKFLTVINMVLVVSCVVSIYLKIRHKKRVEFFGNCPILFCNVTAALYALLFSGSYSILFVAVALLLPWVFSVVYKNSGYLRMLGFVMLFFLLITDVSFSFMDIPGFEYFGLQ